MGVSQARLQQEILPSRHMERSSGLGQQRDPGGEGNSPSGDSLMGLAMDEFKGYTPFHRQWSLFAA
jgi:hypothetical protein